MRHLTAGESHGPDWRLLLKEFQLDFLWQLRISMRIWNAVRVATVVVAVWRLRVTRLFYIGRSPRKTTGAPITMDVINKDHQKWLDIVSAEDIEDRLKSKRKITHPRPGHADLVGGIGHRFDDLRNSWAIICPWNHHASCSWGSS